MSAHCHDCGYDLPLEGPCDHCALRARAERAEERTRVLEEALASADELAEVARLSLPKSRNYGIPLYRQLREYEEVRGSASSPAPTEQGGER